MTGKPAWAKTEQDATPAWFASVVAWMEQDDAGFDALFQENQREAAILNDEFEARTFPLNGMSKAELDAIWHGNARRMAGDKDAWAALVDCLRDNPSPAFVAIIADLIDRGAFRTRKRAKISTEEGRKRRDHYFHILKWAYPKTLDNKLEQRAKDIIAHDEQGPKETYAKARNRVDETIERGDGEKSPDSLTKYISRVLNTRR